MGEVVNLRRARKRLGKEQSARQAAENRGRFGRTQAGRDAELEDKARQRRVLDGAKVEK